MINTFQTIGFCSEGLMPAFCIPVSHRRKGIDHVKDHLSIAGTRIINSTDTEAVNQPNLVSLCQCKSSRHGCTKFRNKLEKANLHPCFNSCESSSAEPGNTHTYTVRHFHLIPALQRSRVVKQGLNCCLNTRHCKSSVLVKQNPA